MACKVARRFFVRYCLISFVFLFRRLYVRQTHFELRIGMFLTADTDLCVVQVNDFFRNIQPQPQSGFVLTAGGIGLVESFKDFRQFFFGNTVSGIAYCKYPAVFLVCKGERDRAAVVDELHGVLHQIVDHLSDQIRISTDANRLDDVMSRLDGVEIWNSRADRKNKSANAMARELAQKWKKPVTAGSDAHVPEEVGGGVTVLEADELSLSAVKAALLRGAKQVEGRRGRAMCVARSQKTKREKTNAGVKRRVNGMLFTVKCALQDFTTREDGWHVMDR